MEDLHKNLIDGEWVGGEAVPNINPSNTDEVVGLYARATLDDTHRAIAAAKAAFPAWSRSGILERHSLLRKTADEILARKEELGMLLSREEGKTLAEGIGEVTRAGQIFDFFAGEALRLSGEMLPSATRGDFNLPSTTSAAAAQLTSAQSKECLSLTCIYALRLRVAGISTRKIKSPGWSEL